MIVFLEGKIKKIICLTVSQLQLLGTFMFIQLRKFKKKHFPFLRQHTISSNVFKLSSVAQTRLSTEFDNVFICNRRII